MQQALRLTFVASFWFILCGISDTVQSPLSTDSEPLGRPVPMKISGPLIHEPSGFEFPESYDSFSRTLVLRYDTAGLDMSVHYNDKWADCKLATTFYVYPTPRMSSIGAPPDMTTSVQEGWLEEQIQSSKYAIKYYHPSLQSLTTGTTTTPTTDGNLNGRLLTFQEAGKFSEQRVFVYKTVWFIKYRFTYPESCRTEATSRIESLISQLPWATGS
jgi:hypothetical protein